jgi:phage/plasmid-like protein (TIGR03299 family)
MAAELNYLADGSANLFFSGVGGTPWHREGVKLGPDEAFSFEGVMDRHFTYPLEKLPYFLPEDPGATPDTRVYVEGKGAHYVWRPDTKKVLGPVGSAYEIVTNRQAFEVLKPLVDGRAAALETGGVLRDGADAWLLVRWNLERFGPDARDVFARDGGLLPYATVMANHSGRRGVMLGHTAIRVVCANTLGAAEREADGAGGSRWVTVTHKSDARSKLVEAAQSMFAGVVERFEVIARQYRLLMGCRLADEAFDRLVLDVVAPDPRLDSRFNPDAKLAEVVVERALRKRAVVRRLWAEGKGHTGEPTAWFAYNGAAEALDHDRGLWPTRAGSWRTASLLDGELSRMKNRVLDNLVGFAAVAA